MNVAVIPASYLLQRGDSSFEITKPDAWLQKREMKVEFLASNGTDAPFDVVVPKLFVPMVEGFGSEKITGLSNGTIWKGPVTPEREVDTI